MTTYDIQINESQRVILVEAMELLFQKSPNEEVDLMLGMFQGLPYANRDSPNTLHMFTF